jgi:hypothetical protein
MNSASATKNLTRYIQQARADGQFDHAEMTGLGVALMKDMAALSSTRSPAQRLAGIKRALETFRGELEGLRMEVRFVERTAEAERVVRSIHRMTIERLIEKVDELVTKLSQPNAEVRFAPVVLAQIFEVLKATPEGTSISPKSLEQAITTLLKDSASPAQAALGMLRVVTTQQAGDEFFRQLGIGKFMPSLDSSARKLRRVVAQNPTAISGSVSKVDPTSEFATVLGDFVKETKDRPVTDMASAAAFAFALGIFETVVRAELAMFDPTQVDPRLAPGVARLRAQRAEALVEYVRAQGYASDTAERITQAIAAWAQSPS